MPMRIRFILLGKTRRAEVRAILDDYLGRIRRYTEAEIIELREASPASWRRVKVDSAALVVLLDDAGKQFTSSEFARWLGQQRDHGVREMVFLCGDAHGFPEELRQAARARLSLSTLTFSHELARIVLAEQVYRALTILAGHPYPK
jgi:23S rRNA (pseudouridine1915-N3)-methyltransferase